ncbi:MAG: DUF1571 domain-containing protein [bacterium]|nr:DUF1571 domain-containing protein [bacterium]
MKQLNRRQILSAGAFLGGSFFVHQGLFAQEPRDGSLTEPVARTAKREIGQPPQLDSTGGHQLDPALNLARGTLQHIRSTIHDYTAIMVKREKIDGVLGDYEYMGIKVRNRKVENGQIKVPFSVYMTFLAPAEIKGREVIYVENQNSGNIVAHEGGIKGRFLPTVTIDPKGMLAMRNQRYPITDCGIENLVVKLIERGERDRAQGPCSVEFQQGAKVDKRECTVLTVKHEHYKPIYDFHVAQIFIDNELQVPVRYCAYEWPKTPGGNPELLEEYTYTRIKTNVGLTDRDFDKDNPKYRF